MAFNFQHTLSLLSCLLLFASSFQSVNSVALNSGSSDKVPVGIYYQSIGSAAFMSKFVPLIFDKGLISIVDLHLSPWGNSKIINNKTVCQGGEDECELNLIEACAINAWPDVAKHFKFVLCVESLVFDGAVDEWDTCFDDLKFDRTPIKECITSGLGVELEKKYAEETAALIPPHTYTPWVVVDGKHIDDFLHTLTYICKAYKGSSPPEACKNLPILTEPSDKAEKFHKVSYKNMFQKRGKFTRTKMLLS